MNEACTWAPTGFGLMTHQRRRTRCSRSGFPLTILNPDFAADSHGREGDRTFLIGCSSSAMKGVQMDSLADDQNNAAGGRVLYAGGPHLRERLPEPVPRESQIRFRGSPDDLITSPARGGERGRLTRSRNETDHRPRSRKSRACPRGGHQGTDVDRIPSTASKRTRRAERATGRRGRRGGRCEPPGTRPRQPTPVAPSP